MKTRESGMPDQGRWDSFFDPASIFDALRLDQIEGPIIDIGCGYGTFTLVAAERTRHPVIAIDIEPEMVASTATAARKAGFGHVDCRCVDITDGSLGIASGSAALVLLFNILHCEDPLSLLGSALNALRPGGRVAAIHWRSDVPTPRGPDLSIRPRPESIRSWMVQTGFTMVVEPVILPPFHFGLVGSKVASS